MKANKFVLAISSELLETILADYQSVSSIIPEILLPDVYEDTLKKIVKFLYTGCIEISPSEISDFVGCCNLLQIKGTINCVGT